MKIKLLLFVSLISCLSYAQEVSIGVRGGLNLANFNLNHKTCNLLLNADTGPRVSFYAGGFAEYSLPNKEHKLLVGLNFSYNGFRFDRSFPDEFEETSDVRLAQLNIPLLFKYNAYKGIYINGGTYLGLIVDAKNDFEGQDFFIAESYSGSEDITEVFNSIDFGLSFGVEYNLANGLFVEANYNMGLTNIVQELGEGDMEFGLDFEGVEVRNRFFMFGVGYKF